MISKDDEVHARVELAREDVLVDRQRKFVVSREPSSFISMTGKWLLSRVMGAVPAVRCPLSSLVFNVNGFSVSEPLSEWLG